MRQPVGPCVFVTPWNFPMAMGTRKIAPAIAAGCTMVVKPAQQTPLSMLALARILEQRRVARGRAERDHRPALRRCDRAAAARSRTRKLSFTGSTEVGRTLIHQAAEQVLRVSMELGGNAPFLVFEDADLDAAVEGAMIAKMRNVGEACTAANRFHVHESIADEFAERLAERMAALKRRPRHRARRRRRAADRRRPARQVSELVDDAIAARRPPRARRQCGCGHRLLLRAHRAYRRARRRARARGGDLRPGRSDRDVLDRDARLWTPPTAPSTGSSPTSTPAT